MKLREKGAVLLLLLASVAYSQKLKIEEVEFPLSKDAKKKGMYISTVQQEDGNIYTYVAYDLKKGTLGFDMVAVDNTGKVVSSASEVVTPEVEKKYNIVVPDPDAVENPAKGRNVMRVITANGVLGKLKVETGYFEPKYGTASETYANFVAYWKVLRGFKFVGNNTIDSDTKLNVFAAFSSPENNVQATYPILEGLLPNTVAYLYEDGEISFLGKNAQFDKDSPNAHNVVITGMFDGRTKSFKNMKETVLEYNINNVTSGYSANGNRAVLLSTLNAPTTIKEHKKWQADGVPYMTYIAFDAKGNVTENVTFKSKSVRGNFGLYGYNNANYVIGSVNGDHDGYYRMDVGKPSDLQITKIVNGAVEKQEVYSMDQIADMAKTYGDKAVKLKYKELTFSSYQPLANGDFLAFADSPTENLIFQIGADAQLKAVYQLNRVPGKDLTRYGVQTLANGDDLYILFREQAPGMAMGVYKSISRGAKSVSFSTVDELMTLGSVVKLNTRTMTVSESADFDEDVILGSQPMFLSNSGGVLLPTRDSKGSYKMVSVN